MVIVIILGLISVLFALLEGKGLLKNGLKLAFTLIFFFLALRYNFGNDYSDYLLGFIEINRHSFFNLFDSFGRIEIGWIILCRLFQKPGFFIMIAVLAFFNCIVYYRFIKNHVPKEYYWLAVFLYIFYPGFMLIHASAMRQSISIALFIVSIDYIFKKDFIRYIIIIGIAALFHTSAIILLPVYFIGNLNWKIGKKSGFIILIIYISSFYFVRDFDPYLKQFIRLSFSKYETSFDQGQIRSGFGIIYIVSLLILILFYERFQKKKIELLFKLALISFAFNPLSMLIHLITRVGMYFTPATLIVYAIILMNMRTQFSKLIFLVVLVFMNLWSFYKFFSSDIWQQAYSTYHTIFSSNNFY